MSFPGYKNSFSEEVSDKPRTKFGSLSGNDFLLNNTVEFVTKMKINDGSFKLKNVVKTAEKDGNVSYNVSNDATLEYYCNETKTSLRTKFKPRALQVQLDFPKVNFFRGSVNPYFRLGSSTALTNLVPSVGWVYTQSNIKVHVRNTAR